MWKVLRLSIALIAVLVPAIAFAAFPKPTGYVNDFAGVLSSDNKARLEGALSSFEKASGDEIAVVTLPSLEGEPVENVAVALFKEWGIGKKGKDNGILFLIAPNDRKMRIEVGYGLEGTINDALAGRILDEAVAPRFRAGDMNAGIAAGALAIVQVISQKDGIAFDAEKAYGAGFAALRPVERKKSGPIGTALKVLFFLVMGYVFIRHPWLFLLFLGGMGRGGGGGGFSGGFGGFGGGLSGGGGASRGW
jgi:uncharacterized protein